MLLGVAGRRPKYWWDLGQDIDSALGGLLGTHARLSDATYTDPVTGLTTTVGNNIPRFESVGGLRAILLEPAGMNVCLRSREFDHGDWQGGNPPVTTADEIGIDGGANTAYTLTDDDGAAYEFLIQDITIPDDSNTHCVSCFIKKDNDETRFPDVQARLNGVAHAVQINTKTGALNDRLNPRSDAYGIIDRGDWWQVWLNITNDSSGDTTLSFYCFPAVTTIWGVLQLAATGSIIIDAAQVELNKSTPSSFIFTTTAAASRATESGYPLYTLPLGLFDAEGTCSVWVRFGYPAFSPAADIYSGIIVTENAHASLLRNKMDDGGVHGVQSWDGAFAAARNLNWLANTWYKLVVKWSSTTSKMRVGVDSGAGIVWGTEVAFDGSYTLGASLRLAFGLYGPMWLRDLRLYDIVLTDSMINALGSP